MAKISIIVPVYNVEKYINQCLESIINQTLSDIEIIIIIDGSTDNSSSICEEFAKKDKRIQIIYQQNKGLGAARNRGIEVAKGSYILFVDSDDWIKSTACEVMYQKALETNADIILTGNSLYFDDCNEYKVWQDYSKYEYCNSITEEMFFETFTPAWGRLYKTNFIKDNHLRFVEDCYYEDNSWGCLVAILAKGVGFVENQYYYRQRCGAITNKKDEKVFDWVKDCEYFYDFIKKYNIKSNNIQMAYFWYLHNFDSYSCQLSSKNRLIFIDKIKKIMPLLNLDYNSILNTKVLNYNNKKNAKRFLFYLKHPYIYDGYLLTKNIIQNIFSVKNSNVYKVVTILGIKLKFRRKNI